VAYTSLSSAGCCKSVPTLAPYLTRAVHAAPVTAPALLLLLLLADTSGRACACRGGWTWMWVAVTATRAAWHMPHEMRVS
jgi:hypothetical protein